MKRYTTEDQNIRSEFPLRKEVLQNIYAENIKVMITSRIIRWW